MHQKTLDPVLEDPRSRELFELARRIARTGDAVLILGPTGSGKEIIARFLHEQGERRGKRFVAVGASAFESPFKTCETMLRGFVARACRVDGQRLQRERARGLQVAKPVLVVNGERFCRLPLNRRRTLLQLEDAPPSMCRIRESSLPPR
jgi:hypothetical protein